jgi:Tol biopolymer transport system component
MAAITKASAASLLILFGIAGTQAAHGSISMGEPQVFEPGVISSPANDGAPVFTPDGNTLYFTRSGPTGQPSVIMESQRKAGHWSAPAIASFSGQWYDSSPAIANDGSYIIFQSTRPSGASAMKASHLWRVERMDKGWGTPTELPTSVNISANIFRPSVAADGSIYFISRTRRDQNFQMYASRRTADGYAPAAALSFSDGSAFDVDPEIAPDQSFLLFSSKGRAPYTDQNEHLFATFHTAIGWSTPQPIHYPGDDWPGTTTDDDPRLSRDGRVLYFISDRSMPVKAPPLTQAETQEALQRALAWDNGSTNVWTAPINIRPDNKPAS